MPQFIGEDSPRSFPPPRILLAFVLPASESQAVRSSVPRTLHHALACPRRIRQERFLSHRHLAAVCQKIDCHHGHCPHANYQGFFIDKELRIMVRRGRGRILPVRRHAQEDIGSGRLLRDGGDVLCAGLDVGADLDARWGASCQRGPASPAALPPKWSPAVGSPVMPTTITPGWIQKQNRRTRQCRCACSSVVDAFALVHRKPMNHGSWAFCIPILFCWQAGRRHFSYSSMHCSAPLTYRNRAPCCIIRRKHNNPDSTPRGRSMRQR